MPRARSLLLHGLLLGGAVACTPDPGEEFVAMEEGFVSLADGEVARVRRCGPREPEAVVLLHGARFSSRDWEGLGTLELLREAGHSAIAVDLPGHGESTASSVPAEEWLAALLDALELERAVVVSPSMSGRFSLPFLAAHPERCSGFVALAPVAIEAWAPRLADPSVPMLLIWGSEDRIVPLARAEELQASAPGACLEVLEGAGHACYLDRPERFHALLLEFLKARR